MTESGPQSEYEATARESLLDVVLEKLHKAGKTTIYSRFTYVAKFNRREQNIDALKAFYQKIIDKYDQSGEVTGLLLAYPACMVHMLEARTSTLMSILREVHAASPSDSRIQEARVVSSTEDIPSRCFNAWYCAFVNTASSTDTMDAADSSTIVKSASELTAFMRKAGPGLVGHSDAELRRRLSSFDSYFEDVPAPELLLSLTPAEDAPSLEEFLDIFDAPINVDLDSESVWPMPMGLKY
mmetsp:Transcript_3901/g.8374  ORF Transcript_3901/g.8374 Transcript_3901/m.8374 type:complete len:240 (+) Transcript_3901:151-870(+)|eukprot:CAMPEP_0202890238 /NCGR_PEP_ID=MMETSP1392-20130828/722_1 /ASSEMBLY_ACC=CAM_ASM_000868 /TAXON_ID=225041 /ORGANISM="Chlamydomonas chlamydogama, Strain SAG 11-48b" /LENGTH=239 /DNA_ID=CAMNT_0049573775 /DNA_START=151 /DNA_END=870 /DNA_ORIENTATION=-